MVVNEGGTIKSLYLFEQGTFLRRKMKVTRIRRNLCFSVIDLGAHCVNDGSSVRESYAIENRDFLSSRIEKTRDELVSRFNV